MSRPCGVVVSAQASPSDLKSAPALPTASRMLSKPRAPGEPVEPRHHQHVAGFEAFDHFGQLGPVGLRATDLLRVDLYAAGGPELCILRGEALAVRAHPGVAVDWHHLSRLLTATYALKKPSRDQSIELARFAARTTPPSGLLRAANTFANLPAARRPDRAGSR